MLRLRDFGEDIWLADGPTVRAFGFPFPTRMIAVKLADGKLWINSPVPATPADMERLSALGPVRHLVAPTPLHLWRLEEWARAFPEAQLWGPPQRRGKNAKGVGVLGDEPPAAWALDLDQMVFRGSIVLNEVYFLHRSSRTLIFGDFIQTYPAVPRRPIRNALMKALGVSEGGVGIDIRLSMLPHKAQAAQSLERLLAWDFDKLILAHGDCLEHDAKAFVRKAFRWLLERP